MTGNARRGHEIIEAARKSRLVDVRVDGVQVSGPSDAVPPVHVGERWRLGTSMEGYIDDDGELVITAVQAPRTEPRPRIAPPGRRRWTRAERKARAGGAV